MPLPVTAFLIVVAIFAAGYFILFLIDGRYFSPDGKIARTQRFIKNFFSPPDKKFHSREIMRVLLGLDERSLAELFDLYQRQYGAQRHGRRSKRARTSSANGARPKIRRSFEGDWR